MGKSDFESLRIDLAEEMMDGAGEEQNSTHHVDASGVFQAAHSLQRCHPDSRPLENHSPAKTQ